MVLSDKEFEKWCRKNNTSEKAKVKIERIRSSEPSRRVRSSSKSVCGRFPSRKMGKTIQFESHKNELWMIYKLENDPNVLEYYDQPPPIKLTYKNSNPNSKRKNIGVMTVSDYFVVYTDRAEWVECKTEDDLQRLCLKNSNRFQIDENGKWRCPPGEEYAKQFGLGYRLHSSKEFNVIFQSNMEFIDDFYRDGSLEVDEEKYAQIRSIIKINPDITLQKLYDAVDNLEISRDDILSLIASEKIYVDLNSQFLKEPETVAVFSSKGAAVANANFYLEKKVNDKNAILQVVDLTPNSEILWDGKLWKILNIGDSDVSLVNELGKPVDVNKNTLSHLIKTSTIIGVGNEEELESKSRINPLILEAKESDLKKANEKVEVVRAVLAGNKISEDIPERTLRDWVAKYRQAQQKFGNGYIGLLPKQRKGNRQLKIDKLSFELLEKAIDENFETLTQQNRRSVYEVYKLVCIEEKHVDPASYATFCSYVKKRSKLKQTLKRKGKRAASNEKEFYWRIGLDTPKHGDRPFHITHIDHTELDIELIDTNSQKNLGRPWLTLLVDAFSRMILCFYLTFNAPSKISCMMTLRDCVKRHGRLPQTIVADGGKEFESVYYETLLATYEVTKKTRPPAEPRFGNVVERLFGTTNTQFIYNLQGNTQITKNVRQVTKSNNPKNLAIWNLPDLHESLSEWFYEVYNKTEHSTLRKTPNEAFERGLFDSGRRPNRIIPYNEEFRLMTLPSTVKGKAKINYSRGIKIKHVQYWNQEFRKPGVEGTTVPVKYDPMNKAIIYAYVNDKWRKCKSDYYSVFKNRSEKEVALATKEFRKIHSEAITMKRLAKFLQSTKAKELLLEQRMKDFEERRISSRGNDEKEIDAFENYVEESSSSKNEQGNKTGELIQFPINNEHEFEDFDDENYAEGFIEYPTL